MKFITCRVCYNTSNYESLWMSNCVICNSKLPEFPDYSRSNEPNFINITRDIVIGNNND